MKWLKDLLGLVRGDPRAVVLHLQLGSRGDSTDPQVESQLLFAHRFMRVLDQFDQDLFELDGIGGDLQVGLTAQNQLGGFKVARQARSNLFQPSA